MNIYSWQIRTLMNWDKTMAFYSFKSGIVWLAKISSSQATWGDYTPKCTSWPSMEKTLRNLRKWAGEQVRGTRLQLQSYSCTEVCIRYVPKCCQDHTVTATWIPTQKTMTQSYILQDLSDVISPYVWMRPCNLASKILKHTLNIMGWLVHSFQWCSCWLKLSRWLWVSLDGGLDA